MQTSIGIKLQQREINIELLTDFSFNAHVTVEFILSTTSTHKHASTNSEQLRISFTKLLPSFNAVA